MKNYIILVLNNRELKQCNLTCYSKTIVNCTSGVEVVEGSLINEIYKHRLT